jgi:hypothetical protein
VDRLYWVKGVLEIMSGLGAQNRLFEDSANRRERRGKRTRLHHEIADAPGSAQWLQHGWIVPTQRKSGYQQQTREDIVGSWLVDQIGRCAMATSVRA